MHCCAGMRLLLAPVLLVFFVMNPSAHAQPGHQVSGVETGPAPAAAPPGQHSPYHAVPPLPYSLHAPLQSLPPPAAGSTETSSTRPYGAGAVIQQPGYEARILEDGRLVVDNRFLATGISSDPQVGPRVFGVFDLTDMLAPQDPYLSDKLELLHQTFARRVAMREAYDERVMAGALLALPEYLQKIWSQEGWAPATRRHILFALWDDCAESGGATLVAGGRRARLQIEEFIRAVLPPGSEHAFRPHEIAAFNRKRTSLARFAPGAAE